MYNKDVVFTHTNLPIEMKPKLVRDRIPEIIEANEKVKAITRILDEKEFGERLIEKMHEETEELALAIKDKSNPEEELADILELVSATADLVGSSMEKIEKIRIKKFQERGGFSKRIMLMGKEPISPRPPLSEVHPS